MDLGQLPTKKKGVMWSQTLLRLQLPKTCSAGATVLKSEPAHCPAPALIHLKRFQNVVRGTVSVSCTRAGAFFVTAFHLSSSLMWRTTRGN